MMRKLCLRQPLFLYSKTLTQLTTILLLLMAVSDFAFSATAGNAPNQIAGIALGSSVKDYPQLTESNYMKEVVITDWYGFRKGIISYGACKYVDTILKIDLKYDQKDKAFYTKLLNRFKERFGEPHEWKGDSFGVILVWKWYFTDSQNNRVSLILQHNSKNSNETIVNIVKLSYPDKIVEELQCFTQMCDATREKAIQKELQKNTGKNDWSSLIPQ